MKKFRRWAFVLVVALAVAAVWVAKPRVSRPVPIEPSHRVDRPTPPPQAHLPKRATQPIKVSFENARLSVRPLDRHPASESSLLRVELARRLGAFPIDPSALPKDVRWYERALPEGHAFVARVDHGVEEFVLLERPATLRYELRLEGAGTSFVLSPDGVIEIRGDDGRARVRMNPTWSVEPDGRIQPCRVRVDGQTPASEDFVVFRKATVQVEIRANASQYPILVDPAFVGTSSMTYGRDMHATVLMNDERILAIGGQGMPFKVIGLAMPLPGTLNTCEIYDPKTSTWTLAHSLKEGRYLHTATALKDGKVMVTGGRYGGGTHGLTEIYDPNSDTWSPAGALNDSRHSHTAHALPDGRVLVIGGSQQATWWWLGGGLPKEAATCEIFDGGKWTRLDSKLAQPRHGHQSVMLGGGDILILGGMTAESFLGLSKEAYSYKIERLKMSTMTFETIGSLGTPRYGAAAALLPNDSVLVAGGQMPDTSNKSVDLVDATGKVTKAASLPGQRCFFTATTLADGRVLVAGGGTPIPTGGLSIYDPAKDKWTETFSMSTGRRSHTATAMKSGAVIFVGGHGIWPYPLNSAEIFDVSANPPPTEPTELAEYDSAGKPLREGDGTRAIMDGQVSLRARVKDPEGQKVKLRVTAVRLPATETSPLYTGQSELVASDSVAAVTLKDLPIGNFVWQAEAIDELGSASKPTVAPMIGDRDFTVSKTTTPPPVTTSDNKPPLEPTGMKQASGNGGALAAQGTVSDGTVILSATVSAPGSNQVRLRVRVHDVNGAGTPIVKQSDLADSGKEIKVTVTGIPPGSYYWEAQTEDDKSAQSKWVWFDPNSTTYDFGVVTGTTTTSTGSGNGNNTTTTGGNTSTSTSNNTGGATSTTTSPTSSTSTNTPPSSTTTSPTSTTGTNTPPPSTTTTTTNTPPSADPNVIQQGTFGPATWPGYVFGKISGATGQTIRWVLVTLRRETDQRYWNGTLWVPEESSVAALGTVEWLVPLKDLIDGRYTVTTTAGTASGPPIASAPTTFSFNSIPPAVTSKPAPGSYAVSAWPGAIYGSTDGSSIALQIRDTAAQKYWSGVKWETGPQWVQAILLSDGTWSYPFAPTAGTYGVIVRASDAAGNVTIVPEFVVALTADTQSNSTVQSGGYVGALTSIVGTATTNDVDVSARRLPSGEFFNNGQWQAAEAWTRVNGMPWQLPMTLEEGRLYQIRSKVQGEADPIGQSTVMSDVTPPQVDIFMPAFVNAAHFDGVHGTARDPLPGIGLFSSGVDRVQVSVRNQSTSEYWNGGGWQSGAAWVSVAGTTTWKSAKIDGLQSGTVYLVLARAFDRAGNATPQPAQSTFMYDANDPETQIVGTSKTIIGTALDAHSGVDRVEVRIQRADGLFYDGAAWGLVPAWIVAEGKTSWSVPLPDGQVTRIEARAIDRARNVQSTPTVWQSQQAASAETADDSYQKDWQDRCGIGKSTTGSGPSSGWPLAAILIFGLATLRRRVPKSNVF